MTPRTYTVDGFEFRFVGTFDHISTCLQLALEGADQLTDMAYLVTVNSSIVYVGEFSGTLRKKVA